MTAEVENLFIAAAVKPLFPATAAFRGDLGESGSLQSTFSTSDLLPYLFFLWHALWSCIADRHCGQVCEVVSSSSVEVQRW